MLAERKDLGQLRASEAGTGSKSPHPIFFRHPDRSEQRSRSGRTSDSFAKAKPGPVSSHLIQKSVILSPVEESEPVLSILEGRSDAAPFLFQSSPAPLCD